MTFSYFLEDWDYGETTLDLDLEVEASIAPYTPARISGPPEDCYPAEGGEVEDLTVLVTGGVYCESGEVIPADAIPAIQAEITRQIDSGSALADRLNDFVLENPPEPYCED